jgi:hypothetical protein
MSILLRFTAMVGLLLLTTMIPSSAKAQGCPTATGMQFECSSEGCDRKFVLNVCAGNTNALCCLETGTIINCCGDQYQNSRNDGTCNSTECSNGGLVVDPVSGRFSKVCFGPTIYEKPVVKQQTTRLTRPKSRARSDV